VLFRYRNNTDITYIRLAHGFVYLVAIIDWYSRKILSWELSTSMDQGFCVSTLERALRLHGTPEIFNSDQGSQFTGKAFRTILEDKGIRISMDGKGRAFDNIIIERFWRTLKYSDIYLKEYESPILAAEGISRFIEKYNGRRPHDSLCNRTPDEVYLTDFLVLVRGQENQRKIS
jgi:putative transposase